MAVTGTVYAAVSKDNGSYAYVDMGHIAHKDDHIRKSGFVRDLKEVPALLNKLKRAVDKSIFVKQLWLHNNASSRFYREAGTVDRYQQEIAKLQQMEFGIVKVTVEEVDPSLY